MRATPIHSDIPIRADNAAGLDALLKRIAEPAGCEAPSTALVIELALYAEERLVAEGIHPDNRAGCTVLFHEHGPEAGEGPLTAPYIGIERLDDGTWAVTQAGQRRTRPGEQGSFGFGYPARASADRLARCGWK